jgi:transcriptional regulator with PAS, ATPase and Fis domain
MNRSREVRAGGRRDDLRRDRGHELAIQAKCSVLQEKKFDGSAAGHVSVDTRVVAATNKSLVDCMKKGSFRVDLYRLSGVHLSPAPSGSR